MKSFLGEVKIFIFWPKTMDHYSPWFDFLVFWESKKCFEKRIPSERASQGEQNGTSFSSGAPTGEKLRVFKVVVVIAFTMYVHLNP